MKFLLLATSAMAVATPPTLDKRQGSVIKADVAAITSNVALLRTAIGGFQRAEQADGLIAASQKVVDAISKATTDASNSPLLSMDEALALPSPIEQLSQLVNKTVVDLIAKRQVFVDSGRGCDVLPQLQALRSGTVAFTTALTPKLPESIQSLAPELSAPIVDSLDQGIAAFRDVKCKSASSTTTSASGTTTFASNTTTSRASSTATTQRSGTTTSSESVSSNNATATASASGSATRSISSGSATGTSTSTAKTTTGPRIETAFRTKTVTGPCDTSTSTSTSCPSSQPAGSSGSQPAGGSNSHPASGSDSQPSGGSDSQSTGSSNSQPAGGPSSHPAGGSGSQSVDCSSIQPNDGSVGHPAGGDSSNPGTGGSTPERSTLLPIPTSSSNASSTTPSTPAVTAGSVRGQICFSVTVAAIVGAVGAMVL